MKKPLIKEGTAWNDKEIHAICWWDDDSPGMMRFVGTFNAPPIKSLFGICISKGLLFYEDESGWFRQVGWYNKQSGFLWLLLPGKKRPDTVLRYQLLWDDWVNLQNIPQNYDQKWLIHPYRAIKHGERNFG